MFKKGIFSRLCLTYTAILFIVFLFITAASSLMLTQYMINTQKEQVIAAGKALEYWTATYQIEQNDARAARAYNNSLNSWSQLLGADITVSNLDGEVISSTSDMSSVPGEYIKKIAEGKRVIVKRGTFGGRYGASQLTVGVSVKYNGTIVGAMFFNTPMKRLNSTTNEIVEMIIVCAALSILAAFILVYIQAKRISKPIGEINRAVQNIAAGNFSDRVRVDGNDEISQLASSFNFMADSIENLENMRSGFISDVSHELRSPMTSISGFAQSILDGTIPEEKRSEYLKIIVDESRRLTKLVNDLLEMSKMSSSEYQLSIGKFDLNELVRVCIISLESRITERSLDLNIDFENDALNVLGDNDAIKRVVLNLMDNAIKFSYENTTISIRTWTRSKKAYFSIGNFGAGIDQKDLSNIFNRFYKTDKSRHREKTGAGLGLSLCKNIVALHKQSIWVESNPAKEGTDAKYTTFTFTLELA